MRAIARVVFILALMLPAVQAQQPQDQWPNYQYIQISRP